MATADADLKDVYLSHIVYQTFRASIGLNIANRSWESQMAPGWDLRFGEVSDANVSVAKLANRTAAETGPTFATTILTDNSFTPFYLRGHARINKMDTREAVGGPGFQQHVNDLLAKKLAVQMDTEIASVITGATYDSFTGTGANKNLLAAVGDDAANYILNTFPFNNEGTKPTNNLVTTAIEHLAYAMRVRNVFTGEHVGDGAPSAGAVVMPPGLGVNLIRELREMGQIDQPGSAGRQAAEHLGIMGSSAWMGRYAGLDIVVWDALAAPAAAGTDWAMYGVPTNSVVAAGFASPEISDADFSDGNTEGRYTFERTVIAKGFAGLVKPEHVFKITVKNDAS